MWVVGSFYNLFEPFFFHRKTLLFSQIQNNTRKNVKSFSFRFKLKHKIELNNLIPYRTNERATDKHQLILWYHLVYSHKGLPYLHMNNVPRMHKFVVVVYSLFFGNPFFPSPCVGNSACWSGRAIIIERNDDKMAWVRCYYHIINGRN